jgi:ATPase subunit of ABC transporter with duplicated ATPase domains
MITGQDTPDSGTLKVGDSVNMVTVGQERMDELNGDNTAYEEICEGRDDIELGQISINARAYCGWFGIKSGLQQSKVKDLSGGERNRCLLAKVRLVETKSRLFSSACLS